MSRSVHTSRPKFRKAFAFEYSSDEERIRVLGKIIDEVALKRCMKANARVKKQCRKAGVKPVTPCYEDCAAASKTSLPSEIAEELVKTHDRRGYG